MTYRPESAYRQGSHGGPPKAEPAVPEDPSLALLKMAARLSAATGMGIGHATLGLLGNLSPEAIDQVVGGPDEFLQVGRALCFAGRLNRTLGYREE
jgi:hypothetical protein